ncbi:MAG: D-tyrosyl-tRNA(Tyr) deacylase [Boseongicola sp.]|nr:D-tyrosyl-tRNA(Tyr) deacylase [Boseongicola sp.]
MRALVQRVSHANVAVEGETIGEIGKGLLILICAMAGDPSDAPQKLAIKISKLRVFRDDQGRMNRSLIDVGGSALVVSQFTLAADCKRGNRPGFSSAAPPKEGEARYLEFIEAIERLGILTATGTFGADMAVSLTNDGPVTIWLDTED